MVGRGPSDPAPSGTFLLPLRKAVVVSHFGPRRRDFHTGIDLQGNRRGGDDVLASRAGTVIVAVWKRGYGKMVAVRHMDSYVTRYAHLRRIVVHVGQPVGAGETLGTVGDTGRSTGAHLHFEILTPSGRFMDPSKWISGFIVPQR